jgi:hypothetical protein
MTITNKILVRVIWASVIGVIAGIMASRIEKNIAFIILQGSIGLLLLTGLTLLIKNGTFLKSREVIFAGIGLVILLTGVLFKSQNISFSWELLTLGLFTVVTAYGLHFFKKPAIGLEDWGKFLFVLLFAMSRYFILMDFRFGNILLLISALIFIALLLPFIKKET